jgi:hypothetical protein
MPNDSANHQPHRQLRNYLDGLAKKVRLDADGKLAGIGILDKRERGEISSQQRVEPSFLPCW